MDCWRPRRQDPKVCSKKLGEIPSPTPLIIGMQELKTSFVLTSIEMNVIQPDYHCIISLPFEGEEELPSSTTYPWNL